MQSQRPTVVGAGQDTHVRDVLETYVASYADPEDAAAVTDLLNQYSMDQFGNSEPLPEKVLTKLTSELDRVPGAFSVLARVDGQPAGLINCFQGFSTFKCAPLLNIHDCFVTPAHRRKGVTQAMLAQVESVARDRGCCKVTLEVLPSNEPAIGSYTKFGFGGYELDPELGQALFWEKKLT